MKNFALALVTLAAVAVLVQAQPAAPKQARSVLDAVAVGQWVTLGSPGAKELLEIRVVEKEENTSIQQHNEQTQKSFAERRELQNSLQTLPPAERAALQEKLNKTSAEARRQYRFNVYEITSTGDDHMIVTGGGDNELVIPKHAIRWISRKLPGK